MFSQRFRSCPKCGNGYLDNYALDKAKHGKPVICDSCDQGFIRFSTRGLGYLCSFILDFLIHVGMYFGTIVIIINYGVYITVVYFLTLLLFAFLLDKVKERYGLLIENSNMPLSTEKQIDPLTVTLIDATADHDINLIQQLLGEGASPADKDSNGYSAMDHARGRSYMDILDIYKEHMEKKS
ncbi:hypothetical protein A9Q79_01595 [Methylophaga sp. 42_25_T18]|mgnify:CR=1 FL=1|nr:hypothetical protein A9Q79_01595 [Methylophaga sp. 42_25_T18]